MPKRAAMLVFGDSIAEGLGARGRGYATLLAEDYGYEIVNYSVSGSTVGDSLEAYLANPQPAEFAVIAHGITEPIVRPHPDALRWAPTRWQRRGWMDPRAYYSSRRSRRTLERLESAARWRCKNIALRRHSMRLMEPADYADAHRRLREALRAAGTTALSLEPTHIDDRYFPGSNAGQESYWTVLNSAPAGDAPVNAVETRAYLTPWDDYLLDHFHPNGSGHAKLAELIDKAAREYVNDRN